jgi:hypothetical protein
MGGLRKTIFGRQKTSAVHNTEIGGVASTLSSPSILAAKLGISSSRVSDFIILGSDIKCNINDGSYSLPQDAFYLNTDITYYKDNGGLVTSFIVNRQFRGATNLHTALFPSLISITDSAFRDTSSLKNTDFTSATTIGNGSSFRFSGIETIEFPNGTDIVSVNNFDGCTLLKSFVAPELQHIAGNRGFQNCSSLENMYIPKCTILGNTVLDDLIFLNIKTGCAITVNIALQNINSGSPDGDLIYAIGTRGAIVTYVP